MGPPQEQSGSNVDEPTERRVACRLIERDRWVMCGRSRRFTNSNDASRPAEPSSTLAYRYMHTLWPHLLDAGGGSAEHRQYRHLNGSSARFYFDHDAVEIPADEAANAHTPSATQPPHQPSGDGGRAFSMQHRYSRVTPGSTTSSCPRPRLKYCWCTPRLDRTRRDGRMRAIVRTSRPDARDWANPSVGCGGANERIHRQAGVAGRPDRGSKAETPARLNP